LHELIGLLQLLLGSLVGRGCAAAAAAAKVLELGRLPLCKLFKKFFFFKKKNATWSVH